MSKKRRFFGRRKNDAPPLDLDALPDDDAEALESLASLTPDVVRPLVMTPPEERYPPLAPQVPDDPPTAPMSAPTRSPAARRRALRYNLLSVLALMGIALAVAWVGSLWQDPYSALNPLPPPTTFVEITATSPGMVALVPTQPMPTESPYPFIHQPIFYQPNQNGQGCEWASIAGTVRDLNGVGVDGYRVRVQGDAFEETTFSGAARTFGEGGFELPLGASPQAATFTVQLTNAQGVPLAAPLQVTTRATCEENVTLINFTQIAAF